MKNIETKSVIDELKNKTKNSNGFYYAIVVYKQKDNIINFQKKKLLQMGLGSPEQTEHEITLNNKLYRIYNSGNIKYVRN